MEIRQREERDLVVLEELARQIHTTDGYPPYMPDDDFAGFVQSHEALAAWVATVDARPVGQIALHPGSSREVMRLAADHLGVAADRIGVVARLLVDPDHRRGGVAKELLGAAAASAIDRGLVPILDVVEGFTPAIELYEREGWSRLGTVAVKLPDGTTLTEHVYTLPSGASTRAKVGHDDTA